MAIEFSPDSRWLAIAGSDRTVRLWDNKNGIQQVLWGHTDLVFDISFSADGKLLASASYDKTIRLWDLVNLDQEALKRILDNEIASKCMGLGTEVNAAAWLRMKRCPLGKRPNPIEASLMLHELEPHVLWGHTESVETINFSADGKKLASAGRDGSIRVWDIEQIQQRIALQDLLEALTTTVIVADQPTTIF